MSYHPMRLWHPEVAGLRLDVHVRWYRRKVAERSGFATVGEVLRAYSRQNALNIEYVPATRVEYQPPEYLIDEEP
jgi:hypothetical protein